VSAIDRYLDDLFDRLAGQGAAGRRMLEETADHLRLSAADKVAAGLPEEAAEREAVAQFGESGRIAALLDRVHSGGRLAAAASGAALVGGRALLMLGGIYLTAALGLSASESQWWIMRQTAAAGGLMLLGGAAVLLARRLAVRVGRLPAARPPHAALAAAALALAGVVTLVDVPLAVGLLFDQAGLWRQAAAMTTGMAVVNCLAVAAVRSAAALRERRLARPGGAL
jgi:hypothetical protein